MLSSDSQKLELLKQTYPKVKAHSHEIGEKTYAYMFAENSEIRKLFKNTTPEQSQRLVDTIMLYCGEVDNFNLIYAKLDKIAHIHIQYGIKNEYYPFMKKAFIQALRDTLKADATEELVHVWAYWFDRLSIELIHIEDLIREYQN